MNQSIEDQIRFAISSVPEKFPVGAKNSDWTRAIFKAIGDLGNKLGFEICTSSSEGEFDGGWLYDLVWYKTNKDGDLESIPLVLESEWYRDYKDIKYDFEKLLVAKARYKIIIFQASGGIMEQYFDKMIKGIQAYPTEPSSEQYLLACFDEPKWQFDIRSYPKLNNALEGTR